MTDGNSSADVPTPTGLGALRAKLDRWVEASPQVPYIAPFMTFLLLMALGQFFEGPQHLPWLYTVRTLGSLAVALMFWKYWPALGRPHVVLAVVFGVAVAAMWVYVHKWFAAQDWYRATQILGKDALPADYYNPFEHLGRGWALWLFLLVRIGGAAVVVPIVEEIFWRGFLLRLFVNRWEFEKVPIGTFTWTSFLVVSLLSAAEHPMWEVGILCWMIYNALLYWKKSLMFLIVTHGVTNLALYTYVVLARDWVFWS